MKINLLIVCAISALLFVSCGSGKKLPPRSEGEVQVQIPLSGKAYQSDNKFWRAVQEGTSPDVSLAKKIALQNARQELASIINSEVKALIENYSQQTTQDGDLKYKTAYEEIASTLISQKLSSVETIGEELIRTADGKYRYHICIQMSRENIKNALVSALSSDERLELAFDKEQFRKLFDDSTAKVK